MSGKLSTAEIAPAQTSRQRSWPLYMPGEILVRALPFALFMAVLALRSAASEAELFTKSLDVRWLYLLQAFVAGAALYAYRRQYSELLHRPPALECAGAILAGLGVFALWIVPMPAWMHLGEARAIFVPTDEDGTINVVLAAIRTAGAVLVVPIMEELFWRSYLMRWIDQREFLLFRPQAVSWFAMLASSCVFALAHDLWFAALLAGMAYATLYRRTGNLWMPVIAHAVTNLALAAWVLANREWTYW